MNSEETSSTRTQGGIGEVQLLSEGGVIPWTCLVTRWSRHGSRYIKEVEDWPVPVTLKHLRSLLGFPSYYSRLWINLPWFRLRYMI